MARPAAEDRPLPGSRGLSPPLGRPWGGRAAAKLRWGVVWRLPPPGPPCGRSRQSSRLSEQAHPRAWAPANGRPVPPPANCWADVCWDAQEVAATAGAASVVSMCRTAGMGRRCIGRRTKQRLTSSRNVETAKSERRVRPRRVTNSSSLATRRLEPLCARDNVD